METGEKKEDAASIEQRICNKFNTSKPPLLDLVVLTSQNSHLYLPRYIPDDEFDFWFKKAPLRGNTNIMVSGQAGIGKTTFVDFYFTKNNLRSNYIRIDMGSFFNENNVFISNSFYHHTFIKLNEYLTTQRRDEFKVDRNDLISNPEYFLRTILNRRYKDETMEPLFLFLDNIDVHTRKMHAEALKSCRPLLAQNNIRIIFASRRKFREYVGSRTSGDFFTWFDKIIDLDPIPFELIVTKRFESVALDNFTCPFSKNAMIFLSRYSNGNLRVALRYTESIVLDAVFEDAALPIGCRMASKFLYKRGNITDKIYRKLQPNDKHPIYLKSLQFLREYHQMSKKFYHKLNKHYGFSVSRLEEVYRELIEWDFFDSNPQRQPGGDTRHYVNDTSRVGAIYALIDSKILYELYLEHTLPSLSNKKLEVLGYDDDPWGGELIKEEEFLKLF